MMAILHNDATMECSVHGEGANIVCMECTPCPTCALFRAKLDREKLAKVIPRFRTDTPEGRLAIVDEIIKHLTE